MKKNESFSIKRRSLLKGVAATSVASTSSIAMGMDFDRHKQRFSSFLDKVFDYIVIGGGPGGGPIAANLAEAGYRVALIEAGLNPLNPEEIENPLTPFLYQVPLLFTGASEHNDLSWDFFVKHYSDEEQQAKDSKYVPGKGILYPRGAALGGSASHNAMVWMYPHDVDFDRIKTITGDNSWDSQNMRKYFERIEACGYCKPMEAGHGYDGYIPANMFDPKAYEVDPKLEKLAHAGEELPSSYYEGNTDLEVNHPLVAKGDTGAFRTPQHNAQHVRITVAERLVELQKKHPENLHIITGALASKVLIHGFKRRAIGVEFMEGKDLYQADKDYDPNETSEKQRIFARREVIVSGGTFNTPQLLMLSGIGPRKELKKHGIRVKKNLPGVGKNLQDRYEVPVSVELKENLELLDRCQPVDPGNDPCLNAYFAGVWENFGEEFYGPYSLNGIFATRIEKSSYSDIADLVIVGLPIGYTGIYPGYSQQWAANRWTWLVLKGHSTNNGGEITLKSADPRETPEINFHHFEEGKGDWQSDLGSMIEGVKIAREYLNHPEVEGLIAREVTPGDDRQSDSEIEEYIRNETWGHHASCSAKIGADDDPYAVLDSQFRVRGVKGLRVVDASAFPFIPGFFPVASVFMISEKASEDIIAADKKRPYRRFNALMDRLLERYENLSGPELDNSVPEDVEAEV